jgi:hypothetical protein
VKSKEFSPEDVHARLDIAWDFDNIGPIVVKNLFIGPLLPCFVKAVALDLEKVDLLRLSVWSWELSQILFSQLAHRSLYYVGLSYRKNWSVVHADHAAPMDDDVGSSTSNSFESWRLGIDPACDIPSV